MGTLTPYLYMLVEGLKSRVRMRIEKGRVRMRISSFVFVMIYLLN